MRRYEHPSWCDPRLCELSESNLRHRSTPIEFASTRDDMRVAVGLTRLDEIGRFEVVGRVELLVTFEDTVSCCPCERDRVIETAFSPTDGRFFMASLGVGIDKLETVLAAAE